MNILVVDDEKRARESVVEVLRMYSKGLRNVYEADGVKSAKEIIGKTALDLVLLDIHLKDGSGFDLIQDIQAANLPVIFITAHQDYAIRAFKASALNYLLKPIDPDELLHSVTKAAILRQQAGFEEKLSVLLEQSMHKNEPPRRIVLRTAESIFVVLVEDIIYCEADKNYTTFHISNRPPILVSGNLGEYEELLSDPRFLRIHQSVLLNLHYIERYEKGDGGFVITRSGQQLPVSSRKKDQLMAYLNNIT